MAIPDIWWQMIKNQSISLKDNEIYIHLKGVRKNIKEAKCRDFYKSLICRIKKLPTAIQNAQKFMIYYWIYSFVWRIIHKYMLILTQTIRKQISGQIFTNTAAGFLRIEMRDVTICPTYMTASLGPLRAANVTVSA